MVGFAGVRHAAAGRGRIAVRFSPLWAAAVLAAGAAACPLIYLAVRAAEADAEAWLDVLSTDTLRLLGNTAGLAAAVTAASAALAVPIAWLTERTDLPGARWWRTLCVAPLAVPSYVGSLAIIAALGPNGALQGLLEPLGVAAIPELYGFWGAWLALTLFTFPYIVLVLRAGMRDMDPALEEASRSLGEGSWGTFRRVTLPQLRVPLAAGALLVALYVVSDFGAVSMMRFDTFTRAIFIRFQASIDRSTLAVLSLVLVALVLVVLAAEASQRRRGRYHRLGGGAARAARAAALGAWRRPAQGYLALVALLALAMPLGVLAWQFGRGIDEARTFEGLGGAVAGSLQAAALAGAAAVIAAMPIAVVAVRRAGAAAAILERLAYVGYSLPGVVVAFSLVFLSVQVLLPTWPGLYQSLAVLVFAYVVLFLPQASGAIRAALVRVQPSVEEASRSLGRGQLRTFLTVTCRLAAPGLASGFALVFLTTMKELPATLLLSPIGFDTLAWRVWDATEDAYLARAAAAGLLLILAAAAPLPLLLRQGRVPDA